MIVFIQTFTIITVIYWYIYFKPLPLTGMDTPEYPHRIKPVKHWLASLERMKACEGKPQQQWSELI